uniref:Ankyrin repeat domain-containing protein n=1 Tax=Oryza meridionalis TaxID=40149 RepID=A0A0E0EBQ2_9ORYZ
MPVQDPSSPVPAAAATAARPKRTSSAPIRPSDYTHSPAHHCVALRDAAGLAGVLQGLPPLAHPSRILTAADAAREARLAASVSGALDRRDVPGGDTALHLAVRLRLPSLASALAAAGADPTLQNHAGWTPLQEALCLGCKDIAACLLRAHRLAAWAKLRRRAPALSAALRRVQDFYLEVDFHFESSVVPLLSRAAPSDTYRIWKRGAELRADTTLAGFDGLRIRRADHSFLFFGAEADAGGRHLPPGSLLVLHRGKREVHDAFAAAAAAGDEDSATSDAAAYRPGLNISSARLVPRTTWLRKEKTESVGEWKARVFDVHNVVFSFRTLKAANAGRKDFTFELAGDDDDDDDNGDDEEDFLPLEIRDDDEDGDFLVADIPPPPSRRSCYVPGRRSVAAPPSHMATPQRRRNSVDVPRRLPACASVGRGEGGVFGRHATTTGGARWKEEETVKTLRPTVWLTEDFPLTVDEFLPLLDILASRVRAVRRLRELLTTKFPPGTFPVKVAIPVVPTVRVVITFTKFVPLLEPEEFFTPMSSPSLLASPGPGSIMHKPDTQKSSYLKWGLKNSRSKPVNLSQVADNTDPFTIPSDYTWVSLGSKGQDKRSSKTKKGKTKETKLS